MTKRTTTLIGSTLAGLALLAGSYLIPLAGAEANVIAAVGFHAPAFDSPDATFAGGGNAWTATGGGGNGVAATGGGRNSSTATGGGGNGVAATGGGRNSSTATG